MDIRSSSAIRQVAGGGGVAPVAANNLGWRRQEIDDTRVKRNLYKIVSLLMGAYA
jgi:hypothetical protein